MEINNFHTFNESMKKDDTSLTASMEDYLEMIYRLSAGNGFTRINVLSQSLNIQPPSASKMVQRLAEMGYIKYEKYGFIMLKEKGQKIGTWLLKRHKIVESFIRIIGVNDSKILQETEKIEHTLSNETVASFETFVTFMMSNPDIVNRYAEFKTSHA